MVINLDASSAMKAIDGNKTYLALAGGAAVIVLNHFGLLPPNLVPQGLDAGHWVQDLYTLLIGAVFRSAVAKATVPVQRDPQTPAG